MKRIPRLPKPITVNTGEQDQVLQTIDDFFSETQAHIERKYHIRGPYFEIKSGELAYRPKIITDDRATYLTCKDVVVAVVLETRTEFNYVRYTFFRNLQNFQSRI